jgi:cobalt/nickel transport system permease protein
MGAAHGHRLLHPGHSQVHRSPAGCKVVGLVLFVLTVVTIPREVYWPYAVAGGCLAVAVAASGVAPTYLARRMVVEIPFVVFAVLLPFIAVGTTVEVLGVTVSEPGLHAGLALLAKATIGVVAGLLLAATTEPRDLLAALDGKLPHRMVEIMAMMVRYIDVSSDQLRRMRIARESRGFVARNPRHWPVLAHSAGAFFVRSYERGERVHLAMLARGYTGSLPRLATVAATRGDWALALAPAIVTAVATGMAWWML